MKDKKWLQDSITRVMQDLFSTPEPNYFDFEKANKRMRELIDQLDEPEVTHEQVVEWIENNEFYCHATAETVLENAVDKGELGYYGTKYSVVKKPVIPKFVADWLDDNIERYKTVYSFIISLVEVFGDTVPEKVWTYASENPDTMARAYLDGYEVEEEQRYNVNFKVKSSFGTVGIFLYKEGDEVLAGNNFKVYYPKEDVYRLTEQEIRGFQNGDILFEHFAVKVEELEE